MELRQTQLSTPPAATSAPRWQEAKLRPPRVPSSQPRDSDRPPGTGGCGQGVPLSESPGSESASLSERETMWEELSPAEESESGLASQETPVTQNRTTHVPIPPQAGESCTICPTGLLSRLEPRARRWAVPSVGLNLILSILLLIFIIALSAKKPEPCPACAACPVAACPDGWVGYLGKCYYFSQAEGNWTYSQSHCSALGASLAAIDTQQEA
ncbi:hypothetical protein KIL84_004038, partial [Mauremys mutica]